MQSAAQALVIGGSIAGLWTARVLAESIPEKPIMGKFSYVCLGLLVLTLAACTLSTVQNTNPPAIEITVDQEFSLRVGQNATLTPSGLTVHFGAVLEDIRCPASVSCAHSGWADLAMTVSESGQPPLTHTLTLPQGYFGKTDQLSYLDHQLRLVTLEPYPQTPGDQIPAGAYQATFVVTSLPVSSDCPPRPDDPDGYLLAICHYIGEHQLNVEPANRATYQIVRSVERVEEGKSVLWLFLNCCNLGDVAVIDSATGEVIDFRVGAK